MPGAYLYGWVGDPVNAWVKCRVTDQGKLIINPTGFLENPPTEDEDKKAPTSEWAFDHEATVESHPDFYTDVDARASIFDVLGSDGRFNKHMFMDYHHLDLLDTLIFARDEVTDYRTYWRKGSGGCDVYVYGQIVGGAYQPVTLYIADGASYRKILDEIGVAAALDARIENPPIEDSTTTTPSSEWAYDHWKNTAAHHAKYTDADVAASWYNRFLQIDTGTVINEDATGISYILLNSAGGDITLKGFSNGVTGQMIFCIKNYDGNAVHVISESGDAAVGDKIRTVTMGDESMAAGNVGSFWLTMHGSNWIVDHTLI